MRFNMRFNTVVKLECKGFSMRRTVQQQSEDKRLQAYMDQYQFSDPVIQIYRLDETQDGKRWRKRMKVGTIPFDESIEPTVETGVAALEIVTSSGIGFRSMESSIVPLKEVSISPSGPR